MLAACTASDAVLLAAVGGPKWDTTDPDTPRPEQGLLGLRKGLGLFANLRPVAPGRRRCYDASPLQARAHRGHRPARRARADRRHLLRREDAHRDDSASDLCAYTRRGDRADRARRLRAPRARRVTSVDKANVLETSRLWREVVARRPRRGVPDIELEHVLVDNAAMQLVAAPRALRRDRHREHVRRHPQRRGGDDHRLDRDAAERVARRARRRRACSSPSTARRRTSPAQGIANPLAMFLSVALLLRHGFGWETEAAAARIGGGPRARRRSAHPRPRRRRDARPRPRERCSTHLDKEQLT